MDIITLALAKKFATTVSAGYSSVSVEGNIIHFTLNDGQKVDMVIPAPADGASVEDLKIDTNGDLLCYLSNGNIVNAGNVPAMKGEPGFSPVVEINQESGITTISITDEEKTSNATIDMRDYVSTKADGDSIQTIEGNKDFTGSVTVQGNSLATQTNLDTVEAIAKGANQAITFDNYESMISAINTLEANKLNIGQNLMIVTLNVPDLWVSASEETKVVYNYTDDETFVSDLALNGLVQVGHYKVSALETQKVDLTNYITDTDYATGQNAGLVMANSSNGVYMTGAQLKVALATEDMIDARTNQYRPIVPSNLEYAVKSVVGGHVVVTQKEYDDMVAAGTVDENTFYYFKEE